MIDIALHDEVAMEGWKLAHGQPSKLTPEEWFLLYKRAMNDEKLNPAKRPIFREHARKIRDLYPDLLVTDSDVENE